MRFKDFIQERAMNAKAFADVKLRLGDTASVGFEFEMIVPDHSDLYSVDSSLTDDRRTERIQGYDTVEEFQEYFEMSKYDLRSISGALQEWQEEKKQDWIDSNWKKYTDGSEEDEDIQEADARNAAAYGFDERDYDESEWIRSEFAYRKEFVDHFGLEPKYGWYDDSTKYAAIYIDELNTSEDSIAASAIEAAKDLKQTLFLNVQVFTDRHETQKTTDKWYIEPDSSITVNSGSDHGIELVSPPQKLQNALKSCSNIFSWMQRHDIYTNSSTGLHINISVPDIRSRLDPLKLVLFMGEKYAAQVYNRENNTYAKPQQNVIINNILQQGELPDSAKALKDNAFKVLSNLKYHSVNLSKLQAGYLEFRVAGGENYHMNFKQVEDSVLRFVSAIELACDPSLEKNEYAKKLTKLISKAGDEAQLTRKSSDVPLELQRLDAFNTDIGRFYSKFTFATSEDEKDRLLKLIDLALIVCKKFKTELTIKERVYFKRLASKIGLTSANIDSMEADAVSRARIKKGIGL